MKPLSILRNIIAQSDSTTQRVPSPPVAVGETIYKFKFNRNAFLRNALLGVRASHNGCVTVVGGKSGK